MKIIFRHLYNKCISIYKAILLKNIPNIKTHLTLEEKYLLHTSISHNSICVEI